MIEMSASSATARPAPTATPLIALMIGVSHSIIVRTMSPPSRIAAIVRAVVADLPGDPVEVAAGAERLALAGDDDGADLGAVVDVGEDRRQLGVHRRVGRVELARVRQRDQHHAVVAVVDLQTW